MVMGILCGGLFVWFAEGSSCGYEICKSEDAFRCAEDVLQVEVAFVIS